VYAMFLLMRCPKDTLYEIKKRSRTLYWCAKFLRFLGGPSPWYLVGLKDGERPASCLEHVKSR
jgi:hypothetical protein